jgi:hypothetical protein
MESETKKVDASAAGSTAGNANEPPAVTPATPAATSDSSEPAATTKKKSKNTVLIVIGVIVLLLLLCACGVGAMFFLGFGIFSEEVVERTFEEALEEGLESDGEVEIDLDEGSMSFESDDGSFEFGSSTEWPDTIPSAVPEFEYGDVNSVVTSSDEESSYWTVGFENIQSDAADKYVDDLEDEGWTLSNSGSYDGVRIEEWASGSLTVLFSYGSEDDTFTVVVEEAL